MKVTLDGFVPYATSQSYKCARGCTGCSSAQRKDEPDINIDKDFYDVLQSFLSKHQISYESISLNCCGDFLLNFPIFLKMIRVLSQKNIIRKWTKILVYTSANSLSSRWDFLSLLAKFDHLISFQVGIPLDLSIPTISLYAQLDYIQSSGKLSEKHSNITSHIVLQRSSAIDMTDWDKDSLLKRIKHIIHDIPMTWAESEGILLTEKEIVSSLFLTWNIRACPFIENKSWIRTDQDIFDFYMLDISDQWLRPHGPGCEKNPALYFGTMNDSIHDLSIWANNLQEALKKMSIAYTQSHTEESICNFCRKHVGSFL